MSSREGLRSVERELMQIPESTKSSVHESRDASRPAGPADVPAPEPPTVVRTSSSAARRALAQGVPAISPLLPQSGETIGGFVIQEAIGVGGMGAVFRAHDVQLDRHVALKLLPLDQTSDPEVVLRFYQEGRSAAQLDHENIARVYSIGQDDPYHFITFEYIEGITLRRRVDENGPLAASEAVDITLQIAQALVHAAGRGVVHRDIKPSNIILTPQGRAKLVDMGLARRFEREADHGLTQSGMTLGTFDYISPEQARDPRDVDVRSDLYSLGCTLFHMLTGRPPFPTGTVLQKLLQHQEEAPPDIRTLNPQIPVELSRVITRLMAKDRDRRYQSPEQLVRDLLVIAGHLGLSITQADQHLWIATTHRITWERHLAWFLPALAFVLVVGALAWWGRESNSPSITDPGLGGLRSPRNEPGPRQRPIPLSIANEGPAAAAEPEPEGAGHPVIAPRNIRVRPGDDLVTLLAKAEPRSVLTLTEDGPYLLGGRAAEFASPAGLVNRDVTIRAEAGVRPVLRFATDARLGDHKSAALLSFTGGHVTIEGLTFELESDDSEDQVAAFSCEDAEVVLRACSFRQTAVHASRNRAAVRVKGRRSPMVNGDRPPQFFADACHFDGGQVGIIADGPVDLLLRDCTLGPGSPSIWIDSHQASGLAFAELRLRHSSFMAGNGPVFEIQGTQARVLVDDCVVAPTGNALPILVAIDDPLNLTWRGRSNLYARMGSYLEPTRPVEGAEAIRDFERWKETRNGYREIGSTLTSNAVWKSPNPLQDLVLEQENPTQAFQLAASFVQKASYGARQGPFGVRLPAPPPIGGATRDLEDQLAASGLTPTTRMSDPGPALPNLANAGVGSTTTQPAPMPAAGGPADDTALQEMDDEGDDMTSLPAMPPMPPMPTTIADDRPPPRPDDTLLAERTEATGTAGKNNARREESPSRSSRSPSNPVMDRGPGGEAPDTGGVHREAFDEDLIRSAEQLANTIERLGPSGGVLRIAREADIEVQATVFKGSGPWQIEAEPGPQRPRLRFRPPAFASGSSSWTVLFDLRSGSLVLQGLDILVQDRVSDAARGLRLAAVGVSPGTTLELSGCTITVAGPSASSSAIVVQPAIDRASGDRAGQEPGGRSADIHVRDSFVRSAGDCVHVTAGSLLDLDLKNALISTEGSLLHAMGTPLLERSASPLKVRIERSLACSRGGLVHLESTMEGTELPQSDIQAGLSVFSTAGQSPLFRVDTQTPSERPRNPILWNAEKVAYDQISTYRRDQILQTGISPRNYSRSDWRNAFDPRDESPVLDGVRFQKKLDQWRSAWSLTKDDLRLDPTSPAADRGPDLKRIPPPPPIEL
jgi:serine/threonine-protein kinase